MLLILRYTNVKKANIMKTNIKSLLLAPLLLLASLFAMTSCDDMIANSLEGTWCGDMYMTMEYNGRYYNSTGCEIEFIGDPCSMHRGTGYWVDYYSGAPWDYKAYHIDWTVEDRVIYIRFREDGYRVEIRNYRLDDRRFSGYVYYDGGEQYFELYHTSSPYWNDYYYDDYYYYNGYGPYYAPASRSEVNDSVPAAPVRHMRRDE